MGENDLARDIAECFGGDSSAFQAYFHKDELIKGGDDNVGEVVVPEESDGFIDILSNVESEDDIFNLLKTKKVDDMSEFMTEDAVEEREDVVRDIDKYIKTL
jgi:hypothetical protein